MQQINLDKNVKIEFTPDQIGYILNVLREQPYKNSVDVITLIQQQVIDQVRQQPMSNGVKQSDPVL